MNDNPDPRKTSDVQADAVRDEPPPDASENTFWELDDVLAHEEISRSLRNMLGDC